MRLSNKIKIIGPLLFLAAYLNVIITHVVCNWEHSLEHSTSEHSHSAGHDHHSHDESHSQKNEPHSHSDKHDHSKPGEGNCCDEETSRILSSVFSQEFSPIKLSNPEFVHILFIAYNNQLVSFESEKEKRAVNYSLPPPKIPDLRIYIQSFQI
ncbi:MAG: hypothetical protein ACOZCO_07185 [Bacteroidota bacterium]